MLFDILSRHSRCFLAIAIIWLSMMLPAYPLFAQTAALENGPLTTYALAQGDVRTTIRVASSYVDDDAMEKGTTEGAYFHIRMQWPSFAVAQAGDDRDVVHIQLMQGKAENMPAMIAGLEKTSWVPYKDSNTPTGFIAYVDKSEADTITRNKVPGYQFLVPTDPHYAGRVYIQCPAFVSGAPEANGCEAHIYLGHFVYGQYRFSYSLLGEWKNIDRAVRSVFETMYKAGNS